MTRNTFTLVAYCAIAALMLAAVIIWSVAVWSECRDDHSWWYCLRVIAK